MRFLLVTLAVLSSVSLPAAGQQPNENVAVAMIVAEYGTATLYYSPAAEAYSVSWSLRPGQMDTRGDAAGPSVFHVTTTLWDDQDVVLGCFNSQSGGDQSAVGVPAQATYSLRACDSDFKSRLAPPRLTGNLHWAFHAGFTSVSTSPDAVGNFAGAVVGVVAGAVTELLVLAICPVTFGVSCTYGQVAVGAAVGLVVGWVVNELDPWCNGSTCTYTTHTLLVNAVETINGIPTVQITPTCLPGGHDTWNVIEEFFYKRPSAQQGVGSTEPYDSGQFCHELTAKDAFLGVVGEINDEVDFVLREAVSIQSLDGDGFNERQAKATDVHRIEFSSRPVGPFFAQGLHHLTVTGEWDYEWKGEKDLRSFPVQSYQYEVSSDGIFSPSHVDGGQHNVLVAAWTGLNDVLRSDAGTTVWQHLNGILRIDGDSGTLADENLVQSTATGRGLLQEATASGNGNVDVTFDLIPNLDGLPWGGSTVNEYAILTTGPEETQSTMEHVLRAMGHDQPIFILRDMVGMDWEPIAEDVGYVLYHATNLPVELPSTPLVTIVETL